MKCREKYVQAQCKGAAVFEQQGRVIRCPFRPEVEKRSSSAGGLRLEHAVKEHKLKRIIYIIPYTSQLLIRLPIRCFEVDSRGNEGDELIFEHHSNIELPEGDEEDRSGTRLLACDRKLG